MAREFVGDEPWEGGGFRLFLAHVDAEKEVAYSLKPELWVYGVNAFVAHADINPGKEWPLVLESALHSGDALAAVLHKGFRESDWCDQEVGIALGLGSSSPPSSTSSLTAAPGPPKPKPAKKSPCGSAAGTTTTASTQPSEWSHP